MLSKRDPSELTCLLKPPQFALNIPLLPRRDDDSNLLRIKTLSTYLRTRKWAIDKVGSVDIKGHDESQNRRDVNVKTAAYLHDPTIEEDEESLDRDDRFREALTSSVLTHPLTLLSCMRRFAVKEVVYSNDGSFTHHHSSRCRILGARSEGSLPDYYWLETWYGLYFDSNQRVGYEVEDAYQAQKHHESAGGTVPGTEEILHESLKASATSRKLFVELEIVLHGPEVLGMEQPTTVIDLFASPEGYFIETSLETHRQPHHSHIGTLRIVREQSKMLPASPDEDPRALAVLGDDILLLPSPGIGHPFLKESWAPTMEALRDYYIKAYVDPDKRSERLPLPPHNHLFNTTYHSFVDRDRDIVALQSYFPKPIFSVRDVGMNEWADRRGSVDPLEKDPEKPSLVGANFGIIQVRFASLQS